MATWSNGALALFHGTDTRSLSAYGSLAQSTALSGFAVNLGLCRPLTDFGRGFYTTSSVHQAREWANARARRIAMSRKGSGAAALVLRFDVDRDWLAALAGLTFVRAIQDYWDFVSHCRMGGAPLQGRASGPFDVVFGPVTIWPSRLLIYDCDQISFHTAVAVHGLPVPTVEAVAPTPSGLFP